MENDIKLDGYCSMGIYDLAIDLIKTLYNENITSDDFSDILVATTDDGRKIFTATLTIGDKTYYCEVAGPFGASWRHTVRIMEPAFISYASFSDDEWYGEEAMREFEKM